MKQSIQCTVCAWCALFVLAAARIPAQITVMCIGNSITAGDWLKDRMTQRYPAVLQKLLGDTFRVEVVAKGGLCVLKNADEPMWKYRSFIGVFKNPPDIIVFMLGTNDSRDHNWDSHGRNFRADYAAMIDTLRSMPGPPKLYCGLIAPAYSPRWDINGSVIDSQIVPAIVATAQQKNVPVIDIHEIFVQFPELLHDGIHPDENGAQKIAERVFHVLVDDKVSVLKVKRTAAIENPHNRAFIINSFCGKTLRTYDMTYTLQGQRVYDTFCAGVRCGAYAVK